MSALEEEGPSCCIFYMFIYAVYVMEPYGGSGSTSHILVHTEATLFIVIDPSETNCQGEPGDFIK